MTLEKIVIAGFAATILTIVFSTVFICQALKAVAYTAAGASDPIVRQLQEEGKKNRDLAKGINRDDLMAWPPLSQ